MLLSIGPTTNLYTKPNISENKHVESPNEKQTRSNCEIWIPRYSFPTPLMAILLSSFKYKCHGVLSKPKIFPSTQWLMIHIKHNSKQHLKCRFLVFRQWFSEDKFSIETAMTGLILRETTLLDMFTVSK